LQGVVTRSNALILNVKSAVPIQDARFKKSEQISASRFHQEVKLLSIEDVHAALVSWLREAYALSA